MVKKKKTITITFAKAAELSQGKSSQYLRQAHDNNADILVLKHSTPYAVLISYKRYLELTGNEESKGI